MQSPIRIMETSAAVAAAAAAASASTDGTSDTAVAAAVGTTAGASSPVAATAASAGGPAPAPMARRFVLKLVPGYHFLPTDAELVVHFLRPRLAGLPLPLPIFIDERVLDYHPEKLIEKYREYGEDRWFFFTRKERKHANGSRPNRATADNGHWNATGSIRPIVCPGDGALVGCVGTLVFYEASRRKKKKVEEVVPEQGGAAAAPAPEELKTDWTMYEYESLMSEEEFQARLKNNAKVDALVLCTIQKKKHCETSKKKTNKRKKVSQEPVLAGGNGEEGSHAGGKKTRNRTTKRAKQKGGKAGEAVKRSPVATASQGPPVEEAPLLGADVFNVDLYVNISSNFAMNTSQVPPLPLPPPQEMMVPIRGDSNNVYPNTTAHQYFNHPMPMESFQVPTWPQDPLTYSKMAVEPLGGGNCYRAPNMSTSQYTAPDMGLQGRSNTEGVDAHYMARTQGYEQPSSYLFQQHMQQNTMAAPQVYSRNFGPGNSNHGYINDNNLLGTGMDCPHLSSFQFSSQKSFGVGQFSSQTSFGVGGSSSSTQRVFKRSGGYNAFGLAPK
ncbi:hypothetical protein ACP70R_012312 [Stipagrostis hirtigluma subsp. patula]